MTKCCPGPPALAAARRQSEGTGTGKETVSTFPVVTVLFTHSLCWSLFHRRFGSAVALAQYLPDSILLPLCFAPNVSTFSLNSASASLFFPHCLFHLLVTSLTQWLSRLCLVNAVSFSCNFYLFFLPWICISFSFLSLYSALAII